MHVHGIQCTALNLEVTEKLQNFVTRDEYMCIYILPL